MKPIRLAAIICVAMAMGQTSTGQTTMGNENIQQVLGAVQLGQVSVKILIAYSADAAILELALPQAGGDGYIPLFVSTYRGIPGVNLDVYATQAGDAIWVQSNWPDASVLAYHHLGSPTAITPFGEMALMDTAFPQSLSGGPIAFPAMDPKTTRKLASFYLADTP